MFANRLEIWKRVLALAVLAMLLGLGRNYFFPGGIRPMKAPETSQASDTLDVEISLKQGHRLYRQGVTFIDARVPDRYVEGRIPGSVNLPANASMERKSALADSLSAEATYVIYCNNPACPLGEVIYEFLQMMGFDKLHILTEGYEGWRDAGYQTSANSEESS